MARRIAQRLKHFHTAPMRLEGSTAGHAETFPLIRKWYGSHSKLTLPLGSIYLRHILSACGRPSHDLCKKGVLACILVIAYVRAA